ncbi:MAG: B12-binding domain-containing radical SAM protein [Planctomycetota bacterium]|jgi:radical SAM superfamily enzyme YgiQ (UPF0313 family)
MAKITFVYPDFESIGVEYLMAICIQEGYLVDFIYYQAEDISLNRREKKIAFPKIAEKIVNTKPQIVAFSCVSDNYQFQLSCARAVKELMPHIVIIFGGIHVTAVPKKVIQNPEVDCVAIGEAEKSFLEFLKQCKINNSCILPNKPVQGIVYKKDGKIIGQFEEGKLADLNSLPFPHKELVYSSLNALSFDYHIMTSRGCPYSCSYCFNAYLQQLRGRSIIRQRSVDNVISELLWAKDTYSPKYILFLDDSFTTNKDWICEFCNHYKKRINLPFSCIAIPNYIDKEKAEILSWAGCIDMQIGVQSIAEKKICNKILNRRTSNDNIAKVIKILRDVGIIIQVDHMLGIPGDTLQIQEESVLFYNKHRPNRISVFWLTYYPKTPIVDFAKQKGVLSENDIRNINEGKRLTSETSYTGGSMKNPKPFYAISFLLNYISFFPKPLLRFVISTRLYKIFSIKNFFLSTVFPRVIQSIFCRKDFRGRSNIFRFINKTFYNTSK